MIELPFTSDPAQSFDMALGDHKLTFEAFFNDRSGVWSLNIKNADNGVSVASGLALVLGWSLLEPYNLGLGELICLDTSGADKDAGADDLGTRVRVYWLSEAEKAML